MKPTVPTIFIASYERPIYLWATLDSLYRATKSDVRFVLIDSCSLDPLVHSVIDGFSRRGMFAEVIKLDHNDPDLSVTFFAKLLEGIGDVFFSVEGDVVINPEKTCWAQRMLSIMDSKPRMAMLGSQIDKSDFTDPDLLEQRLNRKLTREERRQMKLGSSERAMQEIGADDVQSPFNPPGRLLALRTEPVRELIKLTDDWGDTQMHRILTANGWETGIYGGVVHRHLSLCNYFDYPVYSMVQRDQYMTGKK